MGRNDVNKPGRRDSKTAADEDPQLWPMGAVTRRTGIGEHTLRAWERKFGFPSPVRLESGHRRYPVEQVQRLLLIDTALNAGYRAGDVVPLAEGRDHRPVIGVRRADDRHRQTAIAVRGDEDVFGRGG